MQALNWNDLKALIALHQTGSFSTAARALGQDETTVARRLRRLESALATALLRRDEAGRQTLTERAEQMVGHALRIETETRHIAELAGAPQGQPTGTVRVTSVPVIINRILPRSFAHFQRDHPGITVELIPESRNLSLTRREADLALRLGRPGSGGSATLAQRIGWLDFGLYQSSKTPQPPVRQQKWILYESAHEHLDQAKWMQSQAGNATASGIRVADLNTAIEAVANGLGCSLLPIAACTNDDRLQRVVIEFERPFPRRPIWLMSHREQGHLKTVQAVKSWLTAINWAETGPDQS